MRFFKVLWSAIFFLNYCKGFMKLLLHLGKPESVLLGHGQHLWIQNQLTPIPFEARIFHISTRGGTVQDLIQANHMEATWLDLSARILSQ